MRIGLGFDIHKTDKSRKLILGGIEIPSDFGLVGHSDADVLIHAIIDSILGALGKGDIGEWFPDTDKKYKDISSVKLLEQIRDLVKKEGKQIGNIDCNIILEKPKLKEYKEKIKNNIASILKISSDQVNIKAKTNEGMGCIGRGEAVEAQSICILRGRSCLS